MRFISEAWVEFGRISWPTRVQATQMTLQVIGVSLFVAAVIGGIDYVFTKVLESTVK
jgi:preprotein translocase SecE subunit